MFGASPDNSVVLGANPSQEWRDVSREIMSASLSRVCKMWTRKFDFLSHTPVLYRLKETWRCWEEDFCY